MFSNLGHFIYIQLTLVYNYDCGKMNNLWMGWAWGRFWHAQMVDILHPFYSRINICALSVDTLLSRGTCIWLVYDATCSLKDIMPLIVVVLNIYSQNMFNYCMFNIQRNWHGLCDHEKKKKNKLPSYNFDISTPNMKFKNRQQSTWFMNTHRIQEFSIRSNNQNYEWSRNSWKSSQ